MLNQGVKMVKSQDRMFCLWRYLGLYVFPILSVVVLGCGWNTKIVPDEQAGIVAHTVIKELEGPKTMFDKALPGAAANSSRYEAHVDMSVNMKGYLTDNDSNFRKCLDTLTQYCAGRIQVKPFGTVREGGVELGATLSPTELVDPANYDRRDSDLASVIQTFTNQMDVSHLVFTDGVQWNVTNQNYYGDVKCAVDGFMREGGSVALMVFRSSFQGEYTSLTRLRNGEHRLKCVMSMESKEPGRPFVLWAFFKKGDSYSELSRLLEGHGLVPESTIAITGSEIDMRPWDLQRKTAKGIEEGRAVGDPLLRPFCSYSLYDLRPFSLFMVNKKAIDADGYAPLQFELSLVDAITNKIEKAGADAQCEWLKKNVSVDLQCWPVALQKGRYVVTNKITNLNFKNNEKYQFYVPEWPQEKARGKKQVGQQDEPLLPPVKSKSVYLKVNVARPQSEATLFVWVLTLKFGYADDLIPDALTTNDDSAPNSVDRVYCLRPMMGAAMGSACVPARTMILTKWSK